MDEESIVLPLTVSEIEEIQQDELKVAMEIKDKEELKLSALSKLAELGLTEEELSALLG